MKLPGDIDLGMAWAVWQRNATHYRHTWITNILPNFFEPLLYLVGMGIGLGFYVEAGSDGASQFPGGFMAFVGQGLLAAAAMNGSTFETTYNMFVKLNFAGTYDAYLCTPAQIQDIAFGELLWAVTRSLIYGFGFVVVLGGMTLAGFSIITSWWALALPVAIAAIGAMFGLIGEGFTAKIRVIDLYSYYYTLWLTPLFLFSGIFYPVERFPLGAEIAWWTPLYHAVRLCRDLCTGTITSATAVDAAWILTVIAVLMWWVPRAMRTRVVR